MYQTLTVDTDNADRKSKQWASMELRVVWDREEKTHTL